jgi:hypothetical protein
MRWQVILVFNLKTKCQIVFPTAINVSIYTGYVAQQSVFIHACNKSLNLTDELLQLFPSYDTITREDTFKCVEEL